MGVTLVFETALSNEGAGGNRVRETRVVKGLQWFKPGEIYRWAMPEEFVGPPRLIGFRDVIGAMGRLGH